MQHIQIIHMHTRGGGELLTVQAAARSHSLAVAGNSAMSQASGTGRVATLTGDSPRNGRLETQEIHIITEPPIPIHGRGAGSSGVFSGGREVVMPYLARDDVGSFGIYVGNWSGRRRKQVVNDHIAADVIARNAAQIMLAQEVDAKFVEALLDPASSAEAQSAPQAIASQTSPTSVGQSRNYVERPANLDPWTVAQHDGEGDESEAASLLIAAKSSVALSSTAVEWNKMSNGSYRRNGRDHYCYSRLFTAQIAFRNRMHGRSNMQFMNVHFHHMVAKKAFP